MKPIARWLCTGWICALALLALPNCSQMPTFCTEETCPCDPATDPECKVVAFDPGPEPVSDAIMCDIPLPLTDDCATAEEAADPMSVSLTEAATALATGRYSYLVLDFSPAATAACPEARPKKLFFQDRFPDGLSLCINCGTQVGTQMSAKYATPTKACIAKCKDVINFTDGPNPAEGVDAFCEANAHTSTNYYKNSCDPRFAGACTGGGNPDLNFVDPRRTPEPVNWIDGMGTSDNGGTNTLTRTQATSAPPDFDAGAASSQPIAFGDGWVEFSVTETNLSHVLGVRESCEDFSDCKDTDPGIDDIGFAISLNSDQQVYVLKGGSPVTVLGPFGTYDVGDRFRVKFVDNHDNKTATISGAKVIGSCPIGKPCTEDPLPVAVVSHYPLRVDASFREENATLSNVTLVRIIPQ